jgi:hypothetical protein
MTGRRRRQKTGNSGEPEAARQGRTGNQTGEALPQQPTMAEPDVTAAMRQIERLEEYVDGLEMIPATRYLRSAVLLAILSKALTVGRAVCNLVAAGFPAEAFGLTRTLVEIFLTVRYISNKDTEERARTYAEYFTKVHAEWGDLNTKYYPDRKLKPPGFHEEAMRVAEKFKSKHAWTGVGGQTRMMAFEEDTVELDEKGEPFRAEFDYEVIYFWTSHFVHGTVIALDGHAMPPGTIFRVRGAKPKQRLADNALFHTLAFILRTFVFALRAMREDEPLVLQDVHDLIRSYALAWKTEAPK